MSAVPVEVTDEPSPNAASEGGSRSSADRDSDGDGPRRARASSVEVDVEREITKRKLIESITTVLVVILYMVFTLVRDRDSGVVVIDPDARDDWDE